MEDENRDLAEVFAIPDFWAPSKLLLEAPEVTSFLFSELKLDIIDAGFLDIPDVESKTVDGFFAVPDLSFGPANDLSTPASSPDTDDVEVEDGSDTEQDDVDFWLLLEEEISKTVELQTWDSFESCDHEEPVESYLTEAGQHTFDAAVSAHEDFLHVKNTEHALVGSGLYLSSLVALGLGRNSIFFTWHEENRKFIQTLPKLRISGYSGDTLDNAIVSFLDCGNITRFLQSFVDDSYAESTTSGRVALADVVSALLATIQSKLSASPAAQKSILQLQAAFQPTHSILTCFQRVVKHTLATRSDESMLSTIFEEIHLLEHKPHPLHDVLLEVLSRVSQPWLEFVEEWLGIRREAGLPLSKEGDGRSFVKVGTKDWIDDTGIEISEADYVLEYDKIPAFIAPDDARSMFEVGRSLRFLRNHHTDHPLTKAEVIASAHPPSLQWKFTWQDINQVEAKARKYERELQTAIEQYSDTQYQSQSLEIEDGQLYHNLEFFGRTEQEMESKIVASIMTFDQPLFHSLHEDGLRTRFESYLTSLSSPIDPDESIFAPPISLSPTLSFNPVIAAQARIVNSTWMRMFFRSHQLRDHLTLQKDFHLLSNGTFSSKITHALFDAELESAERRRGVARSGGIMGLRLGTRDTWPPASSELRLALMGVLTESYIPSKESNKNHNNKHHEHSSLPGDLSFAVRDMSQDEIDACLNPDSVEALDFLRLSYKPPPPLEAIITPLILYKYDQLFKLLLRVIRMLYVVSALSRAAKINAHPISQRFRLEAHSFVFCISEYFFQTGIEATWRIFERKLDAVEERIDNDDAALGQDEGLDKLRDYHEQVLNRIMFTLLLRKRQQPVLKLLEEIFGLILQFARIQRDWKEGDQDALSLIYEQFNKKVVVFINVCSGLSEKKGYGEKRSHEGHNGGLFDRGDLGEENTIAQLLTKLNMSGYYEKKRRV